MKDNKDNIMELKLDLKLFQTV